MSAKFWRVLLFTLSIASFLASDVALAGLQFTLSGADSLSHAGYLTYKDETGSAALSLDLGTSFRVGYTYMRKIEGKQGWDEVTPGTGVYAYISDYLYSTVHSVDLTIIIYQGEIFVPFIFGGIASKTYIRKAEIDGVAYQTEPEKIISPSGGAGLAIRLSQRFSLRITRTYSQGITIIPGGLPERTLDNSTQIGVSYTVF